ncbi:MAG: FlgD immunoglobulin-like domain containing protein, partial [Candidatus Zixiibacteriota bacterium]
LVVFVQNYDSPKYVLQGAKSGLDELTPLGVEDDLEAAVPTQSELLQNYPNPFNASTKISYRLREPALTKLEIFNLRGELVRSLVNEVQSPGSYQVDWDGTDSEGREVSSGLYFYRLTSGEVSQTQKMSLLR